MLLSGLVVALATACTTGSYPLDVFPEMHYQQSQRRLEPERLAAPAGAVPITGGRPRLTYDQAAALASPVVGDGAAVARGRELYRVNCATCHGAAGRGDGPMAAYYRENPLAPVPPVDLASERVRQRTDGQLYWIVANGLGNMPPYGALLSERDLWATVAAIRELQGP